MGSRTIGPRLAIALLAAAVLSACGGGGGSGSAVVPAPGGPSSPTPPPPVPSSRTIVTTAGGTIGVRGAFNPGLGDYPSGGTGGAVDGITCDSGMSDNYHVHAYVGLYVNGEQVAIPAAIGLSPTPAASDQTNGFYNDASCFYHIHTHDSSGILHIEDPNPSGVPATASLYSLKNALDIWGITTDANHFGPYQGSVRVYTSGQLYRGGAANQTVSSSTYTYYGSDASTIPLYSYEVIFVEVGPTYPSSLPNVQFYELQ